MKINQFLTHFSKNRKSKNVGVLGGRQMCEPSRTEQG